MATEEKIETPVKERVLAYSAKDEDHAEVSPNQSAKAIKDAIVQADPDLEEVSLALPKEALGWLREQAKIRGISTGEMLRTAVGTQKFLLEEIKSGATVQLKTSKGLFNLTF